MGSRRPAIAGRSRGRTRHASLDFTSSPTFGSTIRIRVADRAFHPIPEKQEIDARSSGSRPAPESHPNPTRFLHGGDSSRVRDLVARICPIRSRESRKSRIRDGRRRRAGQGGRRPRSGGVVDSRRDTACDEPVRHPASESARGRRRHRGLRPGDRRGRPGIDLRGDHHQVDHAGIPGRQSAVAGDGPSGRHVERDRAGQRGARAIPRGDRPRTRGPGHGDRRLHRRSQHRGLRGGGRRLRVARSGPDPAHRTERVVSEHLHGTAVRRRPRHARGARVGRRSRRGRQAGARQALTRRARSGRAGTGRARRRRLGTHALQHDAGDGRRSGDPSESHRTGVGRTFRSGGPPDRRSSRPRGPVGARRIPSRRRDHRTRRRALLGGRRRARSRGSGCGRDRDRPVRRSSLASSGGGRRLDSWVRRQGVESVEALVGAFES